MDSDPDTFRWMDEMKRCPACGQIVPSKLARTAEQIIDNMNSAQANDIGVYQTVTGTYAIGRNGGHVEKAAIDDAVERGLLQLRWPDRPDLQWWMP